MDEDLSLQGTVLNSNNCTANGSPPSQKQLPKVTFNSISAPLQQTKTLICQLPVPEKPSFWFHELNLANPRKKNLLVLVLQVCKQL